MSRGLERVGIREVCPFWSSVRTTVAMICTVDVRHQGIQIYVALCFGGSCHFWNGMKKFAFLMSL
jgi:hypothetical protein